MNGDTTLDSGYGSGLVIDSLVAANLRKAGKWARFVGLTLLIIMALSIIPFFSVGTAVLNDPIFATMIPYGTPFFILLIAATLFSLYLYYLLYAFGRKAVQAVDNDDQLAMQTSIASLSRLLTIIGILVVVYLIIVTVASVGSIAVAMLPD